MKPCVQVLTLAVQDLDQAVLFYRDGMGWSTDGIVGQDTGRGAAAFFPLAQGLVLALVPQASLAQDAKLPVVEVQSTGRFSLGHHVDSKDEVDRVMLQAVNAGATVIDPAQDRSWGGYSGYFSDPDGHLWDVVWNADFDADLEGL